jgi:hypothetical protein
VITAEQIPDEVVEAAAKELAYTNGWRNEQGIAACEPVARDIIAAALNAWPGVCVRTQFRPDPNQGWKHLKTEPMLSLPLQETQNAE